MTKKMITGLFAILMSAFLIAAGAAAVSANTSVAEADATVPSVAEMEGDACLAADALAMNDAEATENTVGPSLMCRDGFPCNQDSDCGGGGYCTATLGCYCWVD